MFIASINRFFSMQRENLIFAYIWLKRTVAVNSSCFIYWYNLKPILNIIPTDMILSLVPTQRSVITPIVGTVICSTSCMRYLYNSPKSRYRRRLLVSVLTCVVHCHLNWLAADINYFHGKIKNNLDRDLDTHIRDI